MIQVACGATKCQERRCCSYTRWQCSQRRVEVRNSCKTFPSDDGKVRRVEVLYKNFHPDEKLGTYNGTNYTSVDRAVQQLIVLVAVDEDEQD